MNCPECGAAMRLRDSRYGMFYGCTKYPQCDGTHGAHPDGSPLGTPASKDTKRARVALHDEFGRLWKGGSMSRREAYAWLRGVTLLSSDDAHIGKFDKDQCEWVITLVRIELGRRASVSQAAPAA